MKKIGWKTKTFLVVVAFYAAKVMLDLYLPPVTQDQRAQMRCRDIHEQLDDKPISQLSISNLKELQSCR